MYFIGEDLYFDSVSEATLTLLNDLTYVDTTQNSKLNNKIKELISRIKIAIEDHESIYVLFKQIDAILSAADRKQLPDAFHRDVERAKKSKLDILDIRSCNMHPLLGAQETFLPVHLFMNPTKKMKEVTKKISDVILHTLKDYRTNQYIKNNKSFKDCFHNFALNMIFEKNYTYPGTFKLADINQKICDDHPNHQLEKINLHQDKKNKLSDEQLNFIVDLVIKRLQLNEVELYKIMTCHAIFSETILKFVPISDGFELNANVTIQNDACLEKIMHGISLLPGEQPHTIDDLIYHMRLSDSHHTRKLISDDLMYDTPLYQIEPHRGRTRPTQTKTSHVGIIRDAQLRGGLPVLKDNDGQDWQWIDWTTCEFYSNSLIVRSIVTHEAAFISSYSGTVSLLMNLMISSNALSNLQEKQIYLQSAIAYIVGLGFHGIHEILGPVAHCLNLISDHDYPVAVASLYDADYLSKPPRYHAFYQIAEKNDPEFAERREKGWNDLLQWYKNVYLTQYKTDPRLILRRLIELYDENHDDYQTIECMISRLYENGLTELDLPDHTPMSYIIQMGKPNLLKIFKNSLNENQVIFIEALIEFNKKNDFIIQYDSIKKTIFIESKVKKIEGYIVRYPLIFLTEQIQARLATFGMPQALLNVMMRALSQLSEQDKAISIAISLDDWIDSFMVREKATPVCLPVAWEKLVSDFKNEISEGKIIKEDSVRKHLVLATLHFIYHLHVEDIDPFAIHEKFAKSKQLFESINKGKTYDVFISNNIVKVKMENLGTPLSELLKSVKQVSVIRAWKKQAMALVRQVHAIGYVHGDVKLENFVYHQKENKLYLIDFESAVKVQANGVAVLHVYDASLVFPYASYSMEYEIKLLNDAFLKIQRHANMNHSLASSSDHCLFAKPKPPYTQNDVQRVLARSM